MKEAQENPALFHLYNFSDKETYILSEGAERPPDGSVSQR
jgi:hypothetical protein